MTGESILIIDDNPINLKLFKVLLNTQGYDVKEAINALDALSILETFKPNLILMDWQLPGMDGLALTQKLKADPKFKHILILIISAFAMKGDEGKAFAAGCNGYMSKPINPQALLSLIQDFLDKDKKG
ncbi:MAG: response regulator [Gammaproteobacteria bacterium]|nr:response regulator [Gammaproteobacteria bacterium]